MLLSAGRERTRTEFEHLLERVGFRPERTVPAASPGGLAVMEAVRTTTA